MQPKIRPTVSPDPLPKSIANRLGALSGRRSERDACPMIESDGLTKRFGGRTVVHDVSFACEPGTVTGFLGPNGAGKTTTMRMLVGLSIPDAGGAQVLRGPVRAAPNPPPPGRRRPRPPPP